MEPNYYFDNVDTLIEHLLYKFKELSPLKLQKGLYFLFAFYTGIYHSEELAGVIEESYNYPKYLFNAKFEAWTYGPVIREVYYKNKENDYQPKEFQFGDSQIDKEISSFIDDVGQMIIDKSDFALVDRSHEDKCWQRAIEKGNSTLIPMEEIANEYKAS